MDHNSKTLKTYDDHTQEYADGTPSKVGGDRKVWLDDCLARLPKGATILEIGTGHGRDADYIESKGYKVDRTDASKGFVDYLNKQGKQARLLNALSDEYGQDQDMIFANAVFLHFKPKELDKVLSKAHNSLRKDGLLAFTVKKGDGDGWSHHKLDAPRYFNYWQLDSIKQVVEKAGFRSVEISESKGANDDWLQITAVK